MNTCVLIGRLGRDAVERDGYLHFSLATTERWRDRETHEARERTDWHQVSTRQTNLRDYLRKGKQVGVTGSIKVKVVDQPDGTKRTFVDIAAHRLELLNAPPPGGAPADGRRETPPPARPYTAPPGGGAPPADDIPF